MGTRSKGGYNIKHGSDRPGSVPFPMDTRLQIPKSVKKVKVDIPRRPAILTKKSRKTQS